LTQIAIKCLAPIQRWWKKAAEQGITWAQFGLAAAYWYGRGALRNKTMAYFWANLAAALNNDEKDDSFAKLREEVAAKLSPAELSATQTRCRQWMDAFEKRKAQK
jgi:hypothetical protein